MYKTSPEGGKDRTETVCPVLVVVPDLRYLGLGKRHANFCLCLLLFKVLLKVLYIIQFTLKYPHIFLKTKMSYVVYHQETKILKLGLVPCKVSY